MTVSRGYNTGYHTAHSGLFFFRGVPSPLPPPPPPQAMLLERQKNVVTRSKDQCCFSCVPILPDGGGNIATLGNTKKTPLSRFHLVKHHFLGWDNLSIRRAKQKANLMYKCTNNLAPAYLCNLFAPRISNYDLHAKMVASEIKN